MKLHDSPYRLIKNGIKTIELRLNDEKRRLISVGDEIEFKHSLDPDKSIYCTVIALHNFSSFTELYAGLDLLKCGYTVRDISRASASDMDLYYSRDMQNKYGVIGIEIKVSNP